MTSKSCRKLWIAFAILASAVSLALAVSPARSGEEAGYADDLKPVEPLEPEEALKSFKVADGYHVELVAAEPMVMDPVAMTFDAKGRLYVAEMRGYSERREQSLGRVRRLEDTDGDGRMDDSVVFADGLKWVTAVFPWDGGLFVGAAPDVLYLKDTDGDGKADRREVVFTGMAPSDIDEMNVQKLVNSLRWGLDNRIYGTPTVNTQIRPAGDPDAEALGMRSRDFAFDPRGRELGAITGGGKWGTTFDDWGRMFTCTNSIPNWMVMFENRYIARNPYLRTPSPLLTINEGGQRADVYRISPPERWKIIRTRLRATGEVRGSIERGGLLNGYFTSAGGITIYRGDAYPQRMRNAAVVSEPANNLIYRETLEPAGVPLQGERIDHGHEWVASTDVWFRPVNFVNAPDGTMWVADMYRQTIEHPWSLPEPIKKHLDLNRGWKRGRIYRIAPDGFEPGPIPDLTRMSTPGLVELLAHPNAWHRLTASRLIYQRQDEAAVEPLRELAARSDSPLGRMHAVFSLKGLGALRPEEVVAALGDENPRVRENMIRLAEGMLDEGRVVEKLLTMGDDPDPRVRYQLAFTIGEAETNERFDLLERVLKRDASDRWIRMAAFSSLGDEPWRMLWPLAAAEEFADSAAGRNVLEELARQTGASGNDEAIQRAARLIGAGGDAARPSTDVAQPPSAGRRRAVAQQSKPQPEDPAASASAISEEARAAVLRGLLASIGRDSLEKRLKSTAGGADPLDAIFKRARRIAGDRERSAVRRAEAIRMLGRGSFDGAGAFWTSLLRPDQPPQVRQAAVDAVAGFRNPAIAQVLIDAWPTLGPSARSAAANALFARTDRLRMLLDAVESGRFPSEGLSVQHANRLRNHANDKIASRAEQLLGGDASASRGKVIERYREEMADLSGDPQRGEQLFAAVCATCHELNGVGHDLGPNLAAYRSHGPDAMLANVIAPNRKIDSDYVNYIIKTTDGDTYTGAITAEAANVITITPGGGLKRQVPRAEIESMRSTGRSLMPEGLEAALPPQAMADLLAYLMRRD